MIDPTDSSGSEDGDEVSDDGSGEGVDNDDGVEEFTGHEEAPEPGPSRRPVKNLYAPPTVDEMERLTSAAQTGNTFTLQLEALVASTLLPTTPHSGLKSLLAKVHDLVLGLPTLPAVSPRDAVKRTPDIPFVGGEEWNPLKSDVKWTLGWDKPAEVFVGGSWSVCGGYKKGKGVAGDVDLVVVMPSVSWLADGADAVNVLAQRPHELSLLSQTLTLPRRGEKGTRGQARQGDERGSSGMAGVDG
jgi:U3 small nucleolar RNA-associated protein 22